MTPLKRRITRLEQAHGLNPADSPVIPIVFYPGSIEDATFAPWLVEQLRCDCAPGCSGKRCMFLLPAKVPEDTR
jgi:hypothetical protein